MLVSAIDESVKARWDHASLTMYAALLDTFCSLIVSWPHTKYVTKLSMTNGMYVTWYIIKGLGFFCTRL